MPNPSVERDASRLTFTLGVMIRALISAILSLVACHAFAVDACQEQIPRSLSIAIAKGFPTYRTPLVTDNSADDVSWNLKQGGNGCFGVATADLDGNGVKDFVLGLSSKKTDEALIVVAFSKGKSWRIDKLSAWSDGRLRLFVDTSPAGTYELSEALDGPGPGEITTLMCPHSVAIYGGIESWAVANCFKEGKWLHVQTSD